MNTAQSVRALLATGMSNKQIAAAVGRSVHTVKVHVGRILIEVGARNRAAAAHKLTKEQL